MEVLNWWIYKVLLYQDITMLLKLSIMNMFMIRSTDTVAIDADIILNHTMFDEPTVGSIELFDDYDQLWAAVLDETNPSVSGESMTAQPGWDSEQEERDSFV